MTRLLDVLSDFTFIFGVLGIVFLFGGAIGANLFLIWAGIIFSVVGLVCWILVEMLW